MGNWKRCKAQLWCLCLGCIHFRICPVNRACECAASVMPSYRVAFEVVLRGWRTGPLGTGFTLPVNL